MQLALLALAAVLIIGLLYARTRRDPDDVLADRLEHLTLPWRDVASRLGFGFTAWYDDSRRNYALRGSRSGRAVTVEYSADDLAARLRGATPSEDEVNSRLKVTVHLQGGLPEGIRIRHEPGGTTRVSGPEDVLVGEPGIDEALWIGGSAPSVVRAFVCRDEVKPLLRGLVHVGHGALVTEHELMLTRTDPEDVARERISALVEDAVELARRLESAATGEWRRVAERWGLELVPGGGGQQPMLVGSRDMADIRIEVVGAGPARQTRVEVGWNAGLPDGFRITDRSAPRGEAPEIEIGHPRLDGLARVEGWETGLFRALLLDPAVIEAVIAVVPSYPGATIDTYGVHIPLPGRADAETLSEALEAALTITRRLSRQVRAAARAGAHL